MLFKNISNQFFSYRVAINDQIGFARNLTTKHNFNCFQKKLFLCKASTQLNNHSFSPAEQSDSLEYREVSFIKRNMSGRRSENCNHTEANEIPSIIYQGDMSDKIYYLKQFSFCGSAMGLCFSTVIIKPMSDLPLAAQVALLGSIGFFIFVSPILIHLMAKRYVTELWYNPKSDYYTAKTYTLFLTEKKIAFRVEDVTVPTTPGLTTVMFVSSGNKKLPLFITSDGFQEVSHFRRLMGHASDFGISANDVKLELEKRRNKTKRD